MDNNIRNSRDWNTGVGHAIERTKYEELVVAVLLPAPVRTLALAEAAELAAEHFLLDDCAAVYAGCWWWREALPDVNRLGVERGLVGDGLIEFRRQAMGLAIREELRQVGWWAWDGEGGGGLDWGKWTPARLAKAMTAKPDPDPWDVDGAMEVARVLVRLVAMARKGANHAA